MRGASRRRRALSLAGALAVVAALAGCAAFAPAAVPSGHPSATPTDQGIDTTTVKERPWAEVTPLEHPKSHHGPSTAHLVNSDITSVTRNAAPVLPATVTDNQGTKVTVASDARILALDLYGTLSATVYGLGLGDRLVGRDQSTGFPEARALPLVTSGAHALSAESILKLKPTVIITDTTLGPWSVIEQMRSAGIPVVVVTSQRSLGNIGSLTAQVAAALGVQKEGGMLAQRLAAQLAAERAQIDSVAPAGGADRLRMLFLYVRGTAGVYYIFGKGSGADSLIDALDGVDVASQEGLSGFAPLTAEALARAKPDVILMMTAGLDSVGGVAGALKLPGVAETPAGQNRRIVDMSDYQILSFGPLSVGVLDALARAIYAPDSVAVTGHRG
ncbi:MAG TPA: ABC transporter substrate-binding protein [Gryllotalpicola sp.]